MSDEQTDRPVDADDLPQTSAAALAIALDGIRDEPGLSGPIAEFLQEQRALILDQRRHLEEQLKRLKVSTFDEKLSVALKLMTGLVGLLIAASLAIAVWKATDSHGLVVDAFSAPPDFAQRGIGGEVVAQDILGKLAPVRAFAMEHSYSISRDVSKDGGDFKVEIPETGVSITEAWRLLRNWLGQERHVTGSLREASDGKITLDAAIDGAEVVSLTGAPSDLPALEEQAAEQIFGRFDPVNYANYLNATGRIHDAYGAAGRYVRIARTRLQKSDAYSLWSYTTAYATGDLDLAIDRARLAIGIDPDLAVAHIQLIRFERLDGHDETVLAEARTVLTKNDADQLPAHQGRGFASMRAQASGLIGATTGDFAEAWEEDCARDCTLDVKRISQARFLARMHDIAGSRSSMRQARAAGLKSDADYFEAQFWNDAETGHWAAAEADIKTATAAYARENGDLNPRYIATGQSTHYLPLLALAQARTGEFAAAQATIARTPADCYDCLRRRGDVAAGERNWGAAAFWFIKAVQQAPSIPFAYSDWGRMLMAKGDLDGAIAKFAAAHDKGPHFADPLEYWGEALIAKNRSDLAIEEFELANLYAPDWGRLHLKWGEALLWSGHRDEALKQFAAAVHLDLSPSEKSELARVTHG